MIVFIPKEATDSLCLNKVERALQMSKPLKHRVRNNGENKNTKTTAGGEKESTSGSELATEDNSQHQVVYIYIYIYICTVYIVWKEILCIGT